MRRTAGKGSVPNRPGFSSTAFTVLGVHNVWLDTPAYNAGAIRAYEKVGFREIGRRRARERWPERATTWCSWTVSPTNSSRRQRVLPESGNEATS